MAASGLSMSVLIFKPSATEAEINKIAAEPAAKRVKRVSRTTTTTTTTTETTEYEYTSET